MTGWDPRIQERPPSRRGPVIAVAILFALVLAAIVANSAAYTLDEAEQAIVLQFGEPRGEPVTEPGLHFKLPFIQNVRRFDKRLHSWDGDPNQIPTRGEQFISVDTTARWRIVDPLMFYQRVRDLDGATRRLNDILDSVVRDHISATDLTEIVRSSGWQVTEEDLERVEVGAEGEEELLLQEVQMGRQELVRQILAKARQEVPDFGVELIDIRLKRIDYVTQVREQVFARMIAERQRIAEKFRSEGQGRAAEIDGETQRLLATVRSEARRKAEVIRGQADAEATAIYSAAFGQDPEFYGFFRTLESYAGSVGEDVTMIIDSDSDYFRYFGDTSPGDAAPAVARPEDGGADPR